MFAAVSAVGGYVVVQNRYGFCNGKAYQYSYMKTDSGSSLMTEMNVFWQIDLAFICLLLFRGGVCLCVVEVTVDQILFLGSRESELRL